MSGTLAGIYLLGLIVMFGLLLSQVVLDWSARPPLEQVWFVAVWSVFWPLVPTVWLVLWWDDTRR